MGGVPIYGGGDLVDVQVNKGETEAVEEDGYS